jgi:hypothetical protein
LNYTSYGIPFYYESANWNNVSFHLEVYMRAVSRSAYARLYNETDGVAVSGSVLMTGSASFNRQRSGSLSLTNGKEYRVQFGSGTSTAGEALGGKLVAVMA